MTSARFSENSHHINIRTMQPHEPLPMHLLLDADPSEEIVLSYISQSQTFIAESRQELVGVMVLKPEGDKAEIMNVAVEEAWQNKGIGRQLVEHAKQMAQRQGAKQITVCTGNSTLPALALYQRCGFTVQSIEKDHFLRNYPEPIFENGMQCKDRVKLVLEF